MKKNFLVLAMAFLTLSVASFGAGFNMSGTWKLNASKSKLNDQFSMAAKSMVIVQDGNTLSSERSLSFQDQTYVIKAKYTMDGQECKNDGWQGSVIKSTVKWSDDGKILTINTKFPMQDGSEATSIETFKMEGGVLYNEASFSSAMGEMKESRVYEK